MVSWPPWVGDCSTDIPTNVLDLKWRAMPSGFSTFPTQLSQVLLWLDLKRSFVALLALVYLLWWTWLFWLTLNILFSNLKKRTACKQCPNSISGWAVKSCLYTFYLHMVCAPLFDHIAKIPKMTLIVKIPKQKKKKNKGKNSVNTRRTCLKMLNSRVLLMYHHNY